MSTVLTPCGSLFELTQAYFDTGFQPYGGQDYHAKQLAEFIHNSHQVEEACKVDTAQCAQLKDFLEHVLRRTHRPETRTETLHCVFAHTMRLFFADSFGVNPQADFEGIWQLAMHGQLTLPQRYYLYWQLTILQFTQHRLHTPTNRVALHQLYAEIYQRYRHFIAPFRLNKRLARQNTKTIVVLTNQFLQHQHAPTRVCMEYAHALKTQLGYEVIVINTADLMLNMEIPFYHGLCGHYVAAYQQTDNFRVGHEIFPFTQLKPGLLQADEAESVLEAIEHIDPVMVLALGGGSILADLCGEITRVVSVDYSLSLPISLHTRPVQQGAFSETSLAVCQERGLTPESILHLPAYCIPPEALPETATWAAPWAETHPDAFVLAIAGNRLSIELTERLLDDLNALFREEPRLRLALIGSFQVQAHHHNRWPELFSRTHALGFDKQFTRFYPSTHVFLNPPRLGGGTSGAFALEAGLPVLCLPLENGSGGDVGGVAGPDCVQDWDTCVTRIRHWLAHPDVYAEAKKAAKARYAEITDYVTPLRRVIEYGLAT